MAPFSIIPTLKILDLVVGKDECANVSKDEVEVIERRNSVEGNVQLVKLLQVLEVFNPLKLIAADFKLTQVWGQGLKGIQISIHTQCFRGEHLQQA